jgi:cold shock protein
VIADVAIETPLRFQDRKSTD